MHPVLALTVSMHQVALSIGFGLVTASILALGAVGFTLQFGVTNLFNLAFGEVMTLSAFVGYLVHNTEGVNIWLAFAAATINAIFGLGAAAILIPLSYGSDAAIYRHLDVRSEEAWRGALDAAPIAVIELVDRDTSAKGQDSGPVMTDEE